MIAQIPNRLAQWGATPDCWLSAAQLETIETVCAQVAHLRQVRPEALFNSKRGVRLVAETRQLAMAILRAGYSLTFESIGNIFSNRDHGTVIHACAKVASRRQSDPAINFIFLSLVAPGKLIAPKL